MPVVVWSRFSRDIAAELPGCVAAAEPDTIVLGPSGTSGETLAADGAVQLVTVLRRLPDAPTAVAVRWTRGVPRRCLPAATERHWCKSDVLGCTALGEAEWSSGIQPTSSG